jgi:hypothetical protein
MMWSSISMVGGRWRFKPFQWQKKRKWLFGSFFSLTRKSCSIFIGRELKRGLALLNHLDQIAPDIITTYQLEMEFKNRQAAIKDGMKELRAPLAMQRPGLFSDAKAVKAIEGDLKAIH